MQQPETSSPHPDIVAYLGLLGRRVRQTRALRGMSQRIPAKASGVSERYLAQLEAGKGNASIMVLSAIALDDLVDPREEQTTEYLLLRERLRIAGSAELKSMREALRNRRIELRAARHRSWQLSFSWWCFPVGSLGTL